MTSDLCCLLTLAAGGITNPRWQLHANVPRLLQVIRLKLMNQPLLVESGVKMDLVNTHVSIFCHMTSSKQ